MKINRLKQCCLASCDKDFDIYSSNEKRAFVFLISIKFTDEDERYIKENILMRETIKSTPALNNLSFQLSRQLEITVERANLEALYDETRAFVFLIRIEITVEDEGYLKKKEFM